MLSDDSINMYDKKRTLNHRKNRIRAHSTQLTLNYVCIIILLVAFVKAYLRIQELKLLVRHCVADKRSLNSQMEILYDQRMSLKSLVERERDVSQKSSDDCIKSKNALEEKLKTCSAALTKDHAKVGELTQLRTRDTKGWQNEKRTLKVTLTQKFQQELKNKTQALYQSIDKYKKDSINLKLKLRECGIRELKLNQTLAFYQNNSRRRQKQSSLNLPKIRDNEDEVI